MDSYSSIFQTLTGYQQRLGGGGTFREGNECFSSPVTSCNMQNSGHKDMDIFSHKSLQNRKQSRSHARYRRKCYQTIVAFISINETFICPVKIVWTGLLIWGFQLHWKSAAQVKHPHGTGLQSLLLVPPLPCWTLHPRTVRKTWAPKAHGSFAHLILKNIKYLLNICLMEIGRNGISISLFGKYTSGVQWPLLFWAVSRTKLYEKNVKFYME